MQLLLLGLWPGYLAKSPYSPVISRNIDILACRIGLNAHPNANAHFLPIIGGFVGADTVSVILALKMLEKDNVTMAIDIGTNTEICLGKKDQIMVVSCASGPAFEGMATKFGMRAAQGAIEQISINPKTLNVNYKVIDNKPVIHLFGRLENGESFLCLIENKPYFFISKKDIKKAQKILDIDYEETDIKTFSEEEVVRINAQIPKQVAELRKEFQDQEIGSYESDIKFSYRYLMDKKILGTVEIEGEYEKGESVDRIYNTT